MHLPCKDITASFKPVFILTGWTQSASPLLTILLPLSPSSRRITAGGLACRERKLLPGDSFLRRTVEQPPGQFSLLTHIPDATGFALKNGSARS
jgi:hypothetical protein